MDDGAILLISSDEEIIKTIDASIFKPLRYEPLYASNSNEGLEKVISFSPSAVLLDESIPGYQDFLTAFRQSANKSSIVLLTRNKTAKHQIASFRLGINDLILLPLSLQAAQKTVQQALKAGRDRIDREKLNRKLLTVEAVQITMTTLSHYLNNYATALNGNLTLLKEIAQLELENENLLKLVQDSQTNLHCMQVVQEVLFNTTNISFVDYDNSVTMIDIEDALTNELKYIEKKKNG
jgi:DNA-binding response OmpR family regulator